LILDQQVSNAIHVMGINAFDSSTKDIFPAVNIFEVYDIVRFAKTDNLQAE